MCKAKNMLNENGVVITNIISALEGEQAKFIQHEYATYKAVFDDVKLFAVKTSDKTQTQNLILVGIQGNPYINVEKQEEYKELLDTEVRDFSSDKIISTDDFAPIGN